MALIKCPECGKEISDKAVTCPNCGCPSSEWNIKKPETVEKPSGRNDKEIPDSDFVDEERKEILEGYWCRNCYCQNKIGAKYCKYCGKALTPYNTTYNLGAEKQESESTDFFYDENGERMVGEDIESIILEVLHKYDKAEKAKMIKELHERTGFGLKDSKDIVEAYLNGSKMYSRDNGSKAEMIKEVHEKIGCDLKRAEEIVESYINSQKKNFSYDFPVKSTESAVKEKRPKFHGIYRYSLFGGKTEVYCPRCGSENCSYYQEQKIIPGKTKTKYTANLNPLKPFTLVNKKEKVVRKEKTVTESKIMCNDCGRIFS